MSATITETAVGKEVIDASGENVGIVSTVERGTAYVTPNPGLVDRLRAKLKWGDASDDDFAIDASAVAAINRNQIVLRESP